MPPSTEQPAVQTVSADTAAGTPQKTLPLVLLATAALVMATIAVAFQVAWLISYTNDTSTSLLNGGARIISIIAALLLLWTKRLAVYKLLLVTGVVIVSLAFTVLSTTIAAADALIVGALFLMVAYYKTL